MFRSHALNVSRSAVLWLQHELSTNPIWEEKIVAIVSHDRCALSMPYFAAACFFLFVFSPGRLAMTGVREPTQGFP
jgi:hypothetical protein